jgi:lipid II:glycine glycyltransferase (peptidoglycan interpeptide bridge formation enzyme)
MKNKFSFKNNHPLQSEEWANFREKTGIKVIRENGFYITIHPVPHTNYNIGYFPKGPMPTKQMVAELLNVGKRENCIFIQLEPNVERTEDLHIKIRNLDLVPSAHPLFTQYTFILDLTKTEEELLKDMNQKTRYNIKVAQKHGVTIEEDNSDKAFEKYLELTWETTRRQGFYAHTKNYHRLMWETLRPKLKTENQTPDGLSAHLFTAKYKGKILVTWVVFVYKDVLYYPYGASSSENRETMASNLMMWEVIRYGKKLGLKKFDMWGSMGPEPDTKDPWYGFHRFKQGYGGKLTEFLGSYDLVINKKIYLLYKLANKIRWLLLKVK